MKKVYFLGLLAVLILALVPAMASAHTARVTCNEGNLVVTPDYLHLNPTWTITNRVVTVVWSDGYTVSIPMPEECPTPAPVPPVPEEVPPPPPAVEIPPVVMPPPTCAELLALYPKAGLVRRAAWGCPVPVVKLPPKPDKPPKKRHRVVTCGWILGHYKGAARANMTRKYGFKNCGRPYNPPVAG